MKHNPILCSLDMQDLDFAISIADKVHKHVGGFRLGNDFFTAFGPLGIKKIREFKKPICLDFRIMDIPVTAAAAAAAAVVHGVNMISVHIKGGEEMLSAVITSVTQTALEMGVERPKIFGITVLQSRSKEDLEKIGVDIDLNEHILKIASIGKLAGIDGVICSSRETKMLNHKFRGYLQFMVTGIKPPEHGELTKYKYTCTPREAINDGADYIVVGAPIFEAKDPVKAVNDILKSIS